ncbi:MAG: helix-turn-helix transcriptional regulator [Gammaproteobacteria bacterium]|nr:helix-turn-helix transcriptional regulator [Gammaproteobacteria bacterium]MYK29097.1 helix-turn-helix transcriptional regulator [Gammaproteobacteria bacterium]MYK83190.1 helix-turn-helix transcriptional regulator [Gammaproteobacteria bacterium]
MEHTAPIQISSWPSALATARRRLRMSQRTLSSRTGLPQGHISRIECGAVDPRLSSATKIARTLGFEPMLIPRRALPVVLGILREFDSGATERRPSAIELLVGDGEQDE